MQPAIAIPALIFLAACAVASSIASRNPDSRISRLGAATIGCAGAAALLEVIWSGASSASTATWLMRAAVVAMLPIGPLCLELARARWPELDGQLRAAVMIGLGTAVGLAVLVLETSRFVASATPIDSRFVVVAGDLLWMSTAHTLACLGAAAFAVHRHTRGTRHALRPRRLIDALLALIATAFVIDLAVSLIGASAPRFAPASLVAAGAWFWRPTRRHEDAANAGAFAAEIFDSLSDGVALLRNDGRIRAVNASLEALLGMPRHELIGRPLRDLLTDLPEDPGTSWYERETSLKNGAGELIPVSCSGSPVRDRLGAAIGCAVAVRDEREVVDLQRQLVTSARFAAVGELAAGIAHEVNNPLAFIQANLNQMQRGYADLRERLEAEDGHSEAILEPGEALVTDCLREIARVASIVRDVRGFAHGGEDHERLCDINALLEAAMRMAKPQLREPAEIERDFAELPALICNEQDLKQLFLGVLLHAAQPGRGSQWIKLRTEVLPKSLRICVEDDGAAYEDEEFERVFDPGFGEQAGDGEERLGLSIAYHIARQRGGDMRLESAIGGRTVVSVDLPRTDESALTPVELDARRSEGLL